MAHLKELTLFKEELMYRIVSNEQIMKTIAYPTEDCLDKTVDDPGFYLYKNIFPYRWTVDETQANQETYITMDFADFRLSEVHYKNLAMGIYVFCHKDIMLIRNGDRRMLRIDYILQELDTMLNRSRDFGIGRLQFAGLSSIQVNHEITGSVIAYNTFDFNAE